MTKDKGAIPADSGAPAGDGDDANWNKFLGMLPDYLRYREVTARVRAVADSGVLAGDGNGEFLAARARAQVAVTPTAKIVEALAELLYAASVAFSDNGGQSIENKRDQYALALTSVGQFFQRLKVPVAAGRFIELANAIGDLNSGAVQSIVRRSSRGRGPDDSQSWRARAHVALAFHALVRSGKTREDAANEIGNKQVLKKLAAAKAGRLSTIVINWHHEFRAGRIKNLPASVVFDVGKAVIEAAAGRPAELSKLAKDNLAFAVHFVRCVKV